MPTRLLVVEDEASMLRVIELQLASAGYQVVKATSAEEALRKLEAGGIDLVLTDLKLPGMDGLELLARVRGQDASLPLIIMTAFGSIETAVRAMKAGASDYVLKPFALDELMITIDKVLELHNLRDENRRLKDELGRRYQFENIIGSSPPMQEVFAAVSRVAPTRATVLLLGESGIGKDLIARAVHHHSPRKDHPFVKISCSALPENLMESELFGYEKGAFTGATTSRVGKFEQADGGTLFLDEVGDMSLAAQAKLLRVLQEGVVTRIGGAKAIQVDVRVLAATNKDLGFEIGEARFREDLLYRLNVVEIEVPALRDRLDDVPALVAHFAQQLVQSAGVPGKQFGDDAVARLQARPWPGNIRELRNAVERALILAPGKAVTAADIDRLFPGAEGALPPPETSRAQTFETFKQEAERSFLQAKLREHDWNVSETARSLKMPRSNLYKKIERYGLSRESP